MNTKKPIHHEGHEEREGLKIPRNKYFTMKFMKDLKDEP